MVPVHNNVLSLWYQLSNISIIHVNSFTGFSGITCINNTNKQQQYMSTLVTSAMFLRVFYNYLLYESFVQTNFLSGTICHLKGNGRSYSSDAKLTFCWLRDSLCEDMY